jgi:hypothetical protein
MAVEPGQPAAVQFTGTPPVTPAAQTDTNAEPAWVARLERTFQSVGNQLAAFTRVQTKAAQTPAPDAEPTEGQKLTLASLKKEIDDRERRVQERAIRTEIKSFMKAQNIPKESQPFFEAYIEREYMRPDGKTKLTVNAADEVIVQDDIGTQTPFETLGLKVLGGNGGLSFLAPVETPGPVGSRTNQGVNHASSVDVRNMSIADMQKDPKAAMAGLQAAAQQLYQGQTIGT